MWRQRARVYQQPMSPWAYLLAGLGQGIETGVEQTLREREKKRNMVGEILQAVTEQRIDPAVFGTETGQAFLRYQGLNKSPEIQKLMETGRERYKIPGGPIPTPMGAGGGAVNIPSVTPKAVPMEQFQRLQAVEAAKARRQKFEEELAQGREKTLAEAKTAEELKKLYPEKTPAQIAKENVEQIEATMQTAKARGIPLEGLTVGGVNVLTAYEKAQDELRRTDKYYAANRDYLNKIGETQKFRLDAMKFVTGLEEGMQPSPTEELINTLREVYKLEPTQAKKIAIMPAKQRSALLIKESNRVIDAYNSEAREYAKQAKIRPESVERIEHIPSLDELLKEPEEPKPTSVSSVGGQVSVPPPTEKKEPPTQAEIEVEARKALTLIDPDTGRFYEIGKARQKAKEFLSLRGKTKDQFGYVLGETKTARGANWEYIGNNQWRKKQESAPAEIERKAQEYMALRLVDQTTGRPMTIEQARALARKRLTGK